MELSGLCWRWTRPKCFAMRFHRVLLTLLVTTAGGLDCLGGAAVFRDRVTPHWFAGADGVTNQFWYREVSPGGKTEFVTVNAEKGDRKIATVPPTAADDSLPVLPAPHPSRDSAVETEVTFENHLRGPVELFWIDPGGKR